MSKLPKSMSEEIGIHNISLIKPDRPICHVRRRTGKINTTKVCISYDFSLTYFFFTNRAIQFYGRSLRGSCVQYCAAPKGPVATRFDRRGWPTVCDMPLIGCRATPP